MRRVFNTGCVILRRNFASATIGPEVKSQSCISPLNREGDGGYSKTVTGEVFPKDCNIFHAIGAAEELLCAIGVAREHGVEQEHDYTDRLKRIQTIIIDISTAVSLLGSINNVQPISTNYTTELEEWIKEYSAELPLPEHYVIPGGGVASSSLQLARSICRRAERVLVPLVREEGLDKGAIIYLNRLADFLFVVARIATKRDKRTETIYTPTKTTEKIQDQ